MDVERCSVEPNLVEPIVERCGIERRVVERSVVERSVVERLRRIDALLAERSGARAVLAEVELLVDEARPWLRRGGEVRAAAVDDGGAGAAATCDPKAMIAM